jgi:septum formation protein
MIKNNEIILPNLKQYKIVLCSNSPRRKELLKGLGLNFQTRIIDCIDESYDKSLPGEDIAKMISEKKAESYKATMSSDELIITADTIVYVDGEVLGKPQNKIDAARMLKMISGKCHDVITGVCLLTSNKRISFSVKTKVSFAQITDDEISFYIENYKPYDKAGAYGIQEWIGYIGVDSIQGSYFNVMGLPVQRLYSELKNI